MWGLQPGYWTSRCQISHSASFGNFVVCRCTCPDSERMFEDEKFPPSHHSPVSSSSSSFLEDGGCLDSVLSRLSLESLDGLSGWCANDLGRDAEGEGHSEEGVGGGGKETAKSSVGNVGDRLAFSATLCAYGAMSPPPQKNQEIFLVKYSPISERSVGEKGPRGIYVERGDGDGNVLPLLAVCSENWARKEEEKEECEGEFERGRTRTTGCAPAGVLADQSSSEREARDWREMESASERRDSWAFLVTWGGEGHKEGQGGVSLNTSGDRVGGTEEGENGTGEDGEKGGKRSGFAALRDRGRSVQKFAVDRMSRLAESLEGPKQERRKERVILFVGLSLVALDLLSDAAVAGIMLNIGRASSRFHWYGVTVGGLTVMDLANVWLVREDLSQQFGGLPIEGVQGGEKTARGWGVRLAAFCLSLSEIVILILTCLTLDSYRGGSTLVMSICFTLLGVLWKFACFLFKAPCRREKKRGDTPKVPDRRTRSSRSTTKRESLSTSQETVVEQR
uniref:Uncharacterized protein n=1 Tax=Chromera velia CCMP2878 TaxID=1169474 RepID=A0A0G4G4N7_9ALVE|eukprot:Cvel_20141.t1-p1 / transcript=Cvel_20141.t1 / gene=Cvel_20141 / organism=Chromera_velia_CCMP2878 / gene_product=hypothetical protein / transcript_product=hypothetical protein / location=Cvel_scaffold1787:19216-23043(-) / protein_length=506 / sequence_SO=supercontig / SO=protein_coding / is_pseudo=false